MKSHDGCRTGAVRINRALILILVLVCPPVALAQPAPASEPVLRASGATGQRRDFTLADLAQMSRVSANVVDEKGNHAVYEGVAIAEILRRVGAPLGKDLHGKAMDLYLLVTASDGYRAVFALPELDPGFTDRLVLIADHRDGKSLSPAEGPFRIVAPAEKRHARWVRNVIELSLRHAN
jgi:hypothetical protein